MGWKNSISGYVVHHSMYALGESVHLPSSSHESNCYAPRSQMGEKPRSKETLRCQNMFCVFLENRDSFPDGRSNAPILYGLVTPRSRTETEHLLTTLEKPVLHFENLFRIINANGEQMLWWCWRLSSEFTNLSCIWYLHNAHCTLQCTMPVKRFICPVALFDEKKYILSC